MLFTVIEVHSTTTNEMRWKENRRYII